jgi:predicted alpha/beta-hydrolase family hydrolase
VACRTASATGADAVLALAFPLHPPGRPDRSRADELAAGADGGRPLLVVQGDRDAFGTAAEVRAAASASGARVVQVRGDHGLKQDTDGVAAAVTDFLATLA